MGKGFWAPKGLWGKSPNCKYLPELDFSVEFLSMFDCALDCNLEIVHFSKTTNDVKQNYLFYLLVKKFVTLTQLNSKKVPIV